MVTNDKTNRGKRQVENAAVRELQRAWDVPVESPTLETNSVSRVPGNGTRTNTPQSAVSAGNGRLNGTGAGAQITRPKFCEACGKMFFPVITEDVRDGERYCGSNYCREKNQWAYLNVKAKK